MENSTKVASVKVPMGQKIAFGIGMLANQMFPAALSIFMVVLVQDLGFPGWMWGVIFFFPRIFDCFTDPIMGFISDNTKSKWGRRRQYEVVEMHALPLPETFDRKAVSAFARPLLDHRGDANQIVRARAPTVKRQDRREGTCAGRHVGGVKQFHDLSCLSFSE